LLLPPLAGEDGDGDEHATPYQICPHPSPPPQAEEGTRRVTPPRYRTVGRPADRVRRVRRVHRVHRVHRVTRAWRGRMPRNGAPQDAANSWRKSPKGRAQEAREFVASTRMCSRQTPERIREVGGQEPVDRVFWGVVSFGYFSLDKQRKVTRRPAGRRNTRRSRGQIASAQHTRKAQKQPAPDLRRNEERSSRRHDKQNHRLD